MPMQGLAWEMAFAAEANAKLIDDTYSELPRWNNDFSADLVNVIDFRRAGIFRLPTGFNSAR